jgi:hypothetical protein
LLLVAVEQVVDQAIVVVWEAAAVAGLE